MMKPQSADASFARVGEPRAARGAFNSYWQGHRWKWATDFCMTVLTEHDPVTLVVKDKPAFQVRSMAQLTF